jgi:HEPN domain-containing protein
MSDLEHARAMLEMARRDLKALQGMQHPSLFGEDFFSDEIFGFHAQQSVEKALKAWLSFKRIQYNRTHDLMSLLEDLEESGEDISELNDLIDLNPFAVQYRYESLIDDDVPIDRVEKLTQVQEIVNKVSEIIGSP